MDVCRKTDERNVKEVCAAVLRCWGGEESDAETEKTKVLKRRRHAPHVEGNFATFVYIPVLEDRGEIKEKLLPAAVAKLQHLCEEALLRRASTAAKRTGKQQRPGEQQQQQCGEQQQDGKQQNFPRHRQQLLQQQRLQQQRHLPVEQQRQGASVLRQRQLMLVSAVENDDACDRTSSNGGAPTASNACESLRSNGQSSFCSTSNHSASSLKSNCAASCSSNGGSSGSSSSSNNASSSGGGGSDIDCGRSSGRSNGSGDVVRKNRNSGFESSTIVTTRRYISDTSKREGYVSGSGKTSDTSVCSSSSDDNGNISRSDEDASSRTGGRSSRSRGRGSRVEARVKKEDATGQRKGGAGGTGGMRKPQQQQQDGRKGKRQQETPVQDTQDRRSAAFSGVPSPPNTAAAATGSHTQLGKMEQQWDVVKEEDGNFHISLCRTFMLQFHLINVFVDRMKEKLRHVRQFTLELERTIKIFSNQDSSCFFAAAPVTRVCSDRLMTPLYEAVNEVVCAFGGLQFYQPAHPHLSLAWTLQNLQPVLDSLSRTAAEPSEEAEAVKRHARSNNAAGVAPEISTGSSASGDHEGKLVRPPCGMVAAGDGVDYPLWLRVNCIRIRVGKVVTTVSLRGAHLVDESSSDELDEN